MKFPLIASLLVLALLSIAHGQVQIQMEYDLLGLSEMFDNQGQDLEFIISESTYVNFKNHTLTHLTDLPICNKTSNVVTTTNFSAYCLTTGTSTYLNHILPSKGTIIQKFAYAGQNKGSLLSSGDYIILPLNDTKVFGADVFNTKTSQFYCHVQPFTLTYEFQQAIVSGDFILVVQSNTRFPFDTILDYINCYTGDHFQYPSKIPVSGVFSLNHSSIYALNTINMSTYGEMVLPMFFDLTAQPVLGTGPNSVLEIYKYNDQSLIGETSDFEAQNFNLYSFDANLNFFLSGSYNPELNPYLDYDGFVQNDSSLYLNNGQVSFLYNIPNENISVLWNSAPPVVLGNGSVVNFSAQGYEAQGLGYFIQSPGEPVYFIDLFYTVLGISPDYNEYWLFYNPQFGEFGHKKVCTLTRLSVQNSSFVTYELPKCTCYTENQTPPYFNIFNVTIDENNDPTVAYICSDGAYTVSISNASGLYEVNAGQNNPVLVSTNLESGTLNALTLDYQKEVYIIDLVNVANSKVINSTTLPFGQTPLLLNLPGGNFLTGQVHSNGTTFRIFDVNSFQVVNEIQTSIQFQQSGNFYIGNLAVLGYDEENPGEILGIAVGQYNGAYFIDSNGTTTTIQLPNKLNEQISLQGASNNSFFVYGQDSSYDVSHVVLYTVSS